MLRPKHALDDRVVEAQGHERVVRTLAGRRLRGAQVPDLRAQRRDLVGGDEPLGQRVAVAHETVPREAETAAEVMEREPMSRPGAGGLATTSVVEAIAWPSSHSVHPRGYLRPWRGGRRP